MFGRSLFYVLAHIEVDVQFWKANSHTALHLLLQFPFILEDGKYIQLKGINIVAQQDGTTS